MFKTIMIIFIRVIYLFKYIYILVYQIYIKTFLIYEEKSVLSLKLILKLFYIDYLTSIYNILDNLRIKRQ